MVCYPLLLTWTESLKCFINSAEKGVALRKLADVGVGGSKMSAIVLLRIYYRMKDRKLKFFKVIVDMFCNRQSIFPAILKCEGLA